MKTALVFCIIIKRGLRATVSRLLEKGATVETKDKNETTPFVLAMKILPERKINDSDIFVQMLSK